MARNETKFRFYVELTYNGTPDIADMKNTLDQQIYRMTSVHDTKVVYLDSELKVIP